VNKKYRVHVTDTNGNIFQSVLEDNYPTYITRIAEMVGFNMKSVDQIGNTVIVHFNPKHIVCIAIQEVTE